MNALSILLSQILYVAPIIYLRLSAEETLVWLLLYLNVQLVVALILDFWGERLRFGKDTNLLWLPLLLPPATWTFANTIVSDGISELTVPLICSLILYALFSELLLTVQLAGNDREVKSISRWAKSNSVLLFTIFIATAIVFSDRESVGVSMFSAFDFVALLLLIKFVSEWWFFYMFRKKMQ